MGIDLDETARILVCQNGESSYLRAIRLFEFQICVFYPKALSTTKNTNMQRYARLLAAFKFLELLEASLSAASEKGAIPWRDFSKHPGCVTFLKK
jgi:hypothetical protein